MRHYIGSTFAAGLLLIIPISALAASGYKATVSVSKRVPADMLVVSFHMIERSLQQQESRLRTEELRVRDEIRKLPGVTVANWTSNLSMTNAGFSTTTFNFVNQGSSELAAVDSRRNVIVRIIGLADAEPVATLLARNGIRHGVSFSWTSSTADEVRQSLALDALDAAQRRARDYAAKLGGKPGPVIDAVVDGSTGKSVSDIFGNRITSHPPATEAIVDDEQGRGLIIQMTATVTLRAD